MKKTILLFFATLFLSSTAFSQHTSTYKNNHVRKFSKTSKFVSTSKELTIQHDVRTKTYIISSNSDGSFKLKYHNWDKEKGIYTYKAFDDTSFDGSNVAFVMTSGKLSEYAIGYAKPNRDLLTILFLDKPGLIYKLNRLK